MNIKIDISNASIVNTKNVYIHDDILNDMKFNRQKGELCLTVNRADDFNRLYIIKYIDTAAFEMTNCNFWGISPHILDFEYIPTEKQKLLPKLLEKQLEYNHPQSKKIRDGSYIETVITFTSGDTLIIVCREIIICERIPDKQK